MSYTIIIPLYKDAMAKNDKERKKENYMMYKRIRRI